MKRHKLRAKTKAATSENKGNNKDQQRQIMSKRHRETQATTKRNNAKKQQAQRKNKSNNKQKQRKTQARPGRQACCTVQVQLARSPFRVPICIVHIQFCTQQFAFCILHLHACIAAKLSGFYSREGVLQ